MTTAARRDLTVPRWAPIAGLIALVIASTYTCLPNTWVQDDLPIIKTNALIHSLARPWLFFNQAYWPAPYSRDLYRPFTTSLFALEWTAGGGHAVVFRIMSILLCLAATLAVYHLALRITRPGAAWLAAAFFAVHPVHVEAVAVAVNQAELIVGALMAALVAVYIDRRRAAANLDRRAIAILAASYLAASLFKENGLMLPLLLVAAEVTVIDDRRSWRQRVSALRPFYLLLILVGVCVIGVRTVVLHGNTRGSFTAEALLHSGVGGRALTMLGVVPEWFRLFFWPAHLRADYSPQVIVRATHWGMEQTLGAALLIATFWIAWSCRRHLPAVTFGILWAGIALAPVSNVLVPTGIVLAERTLFLATIGVVIAGGALLAPAIERIFVLGSGRIGVAVSTAVLLGMAASRSWSRQQVWHDLSTLWYQSVIDAPQSYRAHHAYGSVLFDVGMKGSAERQYQIAIALFPESTTVPLDLAEKYRGAGMCRPALRYYQQLLHKIPGDPDARSPEISCLLWLGDYTEAAGEARLGVSYGTNARSLERYARIADSAARFHLPPHSVNLSPPVDSGVR